MKISDIYTNYTIMPSLQLHMYRVASVAQIICDSIKKEVNREHIISACLLHDMGNILKFNLDLFPDFLEPEGKQYWQKVTDNYEAKYGTDEHKATLMIARELGVDERIIRLIDVFQFSQAKENYESHDLNIMVSAYADMRVEPKSVVSLEQRLEDGKKRFKLNKHLPDNEMFFNKMSGYLKKMEDSIFNQTNIKSEDITNEKVNKILPSLSDFDIVVNK